MLEFIVFFFFAAVTIVFALVVILHRNAVVGALSLVASFFALAVMYVLLDAPFLAALQVIVYAGAIMVLFLFVIMLLNLQHRAEPNSRPVQQFLGYFASGTFAAGFVCSVSKYAVLKVPPPPRVNSSARTIGGRMCEGYIIPSEMVSIVRLSAIAGALLLTGPAATRAGV